MKAALKYQFHNSKKFLLPLYLLIYAVFALGILMLIFFSETMQQNAGKNAILFYFLTSFYPMMILSVLNTSLYRETFKLLVQHQLSKNQILLSFLLNNILCAAILSALNTIHIYFTLNLPAFDPIRAFLIQYFGNLFAKTDLVSMAGALFKSFTVSLLIGMLGVLTAALLFRMSKSRRTVFSFAGFIVFVFLFPLLYDYMLSADSFFYSVIRIAALLAATALSRLIMHKTSV